MNQLKQYLAIGCISFTFCTVFYLLFRFMNIFPPLSEDLVIKMLFISISITGLIGMTHLLPIQNSLVLRFLEMLNITIVLLIAGAFFNLFPFNWFNIVFAITTGLLTYFMVIIITFMGNKTSATQINHAIALKKGSVSNDEYD